MKILLPFSGGFDSTLCLIMALEQGHDVSIIYSILQNNKISSAIEKRARTKVIACLERVYDKYLPIKKILTSLTHIANCDYKQMPLWMNTVAMGYEGEQEIWLGYKRNDVAISKMSEIEAHVNASNKLYNVNISLKPIDPIVVKFPLKDFGRSEVIGLIQEFDKKHNTDIERMCITCETGELVTAESCECSSCSELIYAMGQEYYDAHVENLIERYSNIFPPLASDCKKSSAWCQIDLFDPNEVGVMYV